MGAFEFVHDDGGAVESGFGDGGCVARAIAIATGRSYASVYWALRDWKRKRGMFDASPRAGVPIAGVHDVLRWPWTPGRSFTLPRGRLILAFDHADGFIGVGHMAAMIDHVVHDTPEMWFGEPMAVIGVWLPAKRTPIP